MNIFAIYCDGSEGVRVNCECVKGIAFKNAALWVNCALLPVICAGNGLLRDNCAHFYRIECLLPHIIA